MAHTWGKAAGVLILVPVLREAALSWDRVSWTGETLAAGKRAAEQAIACLDEQSRS